PLLPFSSPTQQHPNLSTMDSSVERANLAGNAMANARCTPIAPGTTHRSELFASTDQNLWHGSPAGARTSAKWHVIATHGRCVSTEKTWLSTRAVLSQHAEPVVFISAGGSSVRPTRRPSPCRTDEARGNLVRI